jgi:lactose/L-arabinose transport system substrate-binding protein
LKKKLAVLFLINILIFTFSGLAAAQNGDQVTLTVWCWDPSFNIYAMEEAAKLYRDINPDVTIKVEETAWEDIQTRLTTALSANQAATLPDIILMQDNALIKNVSTFPDAFYDLTNSAIDFSKFADYKIALTTYNGKNYGVPFDNGAAINAMRIDVLEEAGYTIDDFTDITWQEFIEKGADVRKKTGKPLLSVIAGQPDLLMVMLQSAGTWLFNDAGEVNIANNDVLKEIVDIYVELVDKGIMVQVNDWDQYISSFNSGTVAGTINGCWIIGSIVPQKSQAGDWRITNIPRLASVDGSVNYSNQGGSSWMVMANSKHPQIAADFLNKTFAGSIELYETILPSSGALATYLPAGDSEVYNMPQPFFGGQKIYSEITDYAAQVPQVNYGVYNYEARDAVGAAITKIINGQDVDKALQEAEETVKFLMW